MKLRPYEAADVKAVAGWISDERTHAMWSANRFSFPLKEAEFASFLTSLHESTGDMPFIAEDENGEAVGFFCCPMGRGAEERMLKFIIVDSSRRGRGYGKEMLRLAAAQAFEDGAPAVTLNVFTVNERAKRCYLGAGFEERSSTENAFAFKDELWGRCSMVMKNRAE